MKQYTDHIGDTNKMVEQVPDVRKMEKHLMREKNTTIKLITKTNNI